MQLFPRGTGSGSKSCMGYLRKLTIQHLRGFRTAQTIDAAIPNGTPGSGLTVLVGANNSGKSTIMEAFTALSRREPTSYSIGKRNAYSDQKITIFAQFENDQQILMETVPSGGSQTRWTSRDFDPEIAIVPSRRGFEPFFGKVNAIDRRQYNLQVENSTGFRPQTLNPLFAGRLFRIDHESGEDRREFDKLLARVIGTHAQNWTIEQQETGQHFLKFELGTPGYYHSSDGVGDGIVSLFVLLSQLYDIGPESIVAIDEPELSLHPQYQRRLRELLSEKASQSQIIYTTHSPYFVNWVDLTNGAEIIRTYRDGDQGTVARQATRSAVDALSPMLQNTHAPHVLDLHASEIFFIEDGVIVTEGQEDVLYLPKIGAEIGEQLRGSYYGWGAGGSGNITKILRLLNDLGYRKVVAIFDGDKADEAAICQQTFSQYHVAVLPADDIRSKPERGKVGLWIDSGVDPSKKEQAIQLFTEINAYLDS